MAVLNWTIMTFSLANTILLFWLGFTVLLNAERPTWGARIMSGGMLVSAVFFVSHTAIVGNGLLSTDPTMTFWWYLGLLTALLLPFVWYIDILWYAGFWEKHKASPVRQRVCLALSSASTLVLIGLLFFANPFPSYQQAITLNLVLTPTVRGVPILILAYIGSTLANIAFSFDVLWRPIPDSPVMSDVIRRRARPWLLATCGALLLISLLVAGVMLWVVLKSKELTLGQLNQRNIEWISLLDVMISGAVTVSIVLIGQAIVRYEVFTGKMLPQQRYLRHWSNIITLALAYGAIMSAGLQLQVQPIYSLLLVAVLLTLFYAMFRRASTIERQRYIRQLRPFVLSQRLYDNLIQGAVPTEVDLETPFHALCRDLLGARLAHLVPLGPLAPLIGAGMSYPSSITPPHISQSEFSTPQSICIAIDPVQYGGAAWVVPLWSERGQSGVLLLGEKESGGLYTQEEIEVARATGERLIDTQASAEMARRLMGLQRQRLAESQVVDRRTRRTLHDDVLPRLHAAMLTLGAQKALAAAGQAGVPSNGQTAQVPETVQLLSEVHHQIADLLLEMPTKIAPEVSRDGLIPALREVVSAEVGTAFDQADWEVQAEVEQETRGIPPLMAEVVYYAAREAVRNAARHGRGKNADRRLQLRVRANWHKGLELLVEDNGVGFEPTHQSGHGLALHSTMMAVIGGSLSIESIPNQLTRLTLTLPRDTW